MRTAVPVDGRFEQIVLSCNITADHAIIWIQRESQRALDVSTSEMFASCDHFSLLVNSSDKPFSAW